MELEASGEKGVIDGEVGLSRGGVDPIVLRGVADGLSFIHHILFQGGLIVLGDFLLKLHFEAESFPTVDHVVEDGDIYSLHDWVDSGDVAGISIEGDG